VAAAAATRLYDAIRSGEMEAPCLERLLVRCLRAACVTAAAGGTAAAAWGARASQPQSSSQPAATAVVPLPQQAVTSATIEAAAEVDNGAAAFAFLAEVSLALVQRHADDSHTWADIVWQPPPAAALEMYEQDSDSEGAPAESELGSGSGVSPSDSASQASGSASPGGSGGAAAAAARSVALPPMLANLYHHLAAYARDVESYRMLHALRLALQRVTLGHLTRLDGVPVGSQPAARP
jgi:hypothetical protein